MPASRFLRLRWLRLQPWSLRPLSEVPSARSSVAIAVPLPAATGLRCSAEGHWPPGGLAWPAVHLVVAALGGALGGVLGASVANAYLREDKSFHIELLQGGQGVPVVVCNGFLSEGGTGLGRVARPLSPGDFPTHLCTGCIGAPRNSEIWESLPVSGQ